MQRLITPLPAGAIALAGTFAAGAISAQQPAAVNVTVQRVAMRPRMLPSSGGDAYLKVAVAAQGAQVEQVSAFAKLANGTRSDLFPLTRGSQGKYTGEVRVPGNGSVRPIQVKLMVQVELRGGTKVSRVAGTITVLPTDGDSPPPPPPDE